MGDDQAACHADARRSGDPVQWSRHMAGNGDAARVPTVEQARCRESVMDEQLLHVAAMVRDGSPRGNRPLIDQVESVDSLFGAAADEWMARSGFSPTGWRHAVNQDAFVRTYKHH